jgi:hypothetical protein
MNRAAGLRALAAGAAATASTYFEFARGLFRDEDWERDPELAFALFAEGSEAAYQASEFALALELLDRLQSRALRPDQRALADAQRIAVLSITAPEAALDLTLETLRRFGVRWPKQPSIPRILVSILYTAWKIGDPLDDRAFAKRDWHDENWEQQAAIIRAGGAILMQTSILLVVIATNYGLRRELRCGARSGIGLALAAFAGGWLTCGGSWKRFQRYVQAALHWIERTPGPIHTRAQFSLEAYSLCLMRPRRSVMDSLERTTETLRELGDLEYADYAVRIRLHYRALCGEPLDALQRAALAAPPKHRVMVEPYRLLQGDAATPIDWSAALARADQDLAGVPALHAIAPRLHWILVLCYFGEYATAARESERFAPEINTATAGGGAICEYALFRGLSAAALAQTAAGAPRRRQQRILKQSLGQLRIWASRGPDFVHMQQFLEAEQAALRGAVPQALRAYTQAAQRAREHGFRHHAALIHERQAALLRRRNRTTESIAALRQALELYREWGATAKVGALEKATAQPRSAARP